MTNYLLGSNSILGVVPDPYKDLFVDDAAPYANAPASLMRAQIAQMAQAQMDNAAQQAYPTPNIGKYPTSNTTMLAPALLGDRARELFLKRMGGIRRQMQVATDDFVQCHIYGEMVHLFYCFSGKTGVTQEQIDIFPSDTLITQFRMILAS